MGALPAIATPPLAVAHTVRPACAYERRAPEDSALHRAVRQGWPEVQAAIREQTGGKLSDYLHKAVKAYLDPGESTDELPEGDWEIVIGGVSDGPQGAARRSSGCAGLFD